MEARTDSNVSAENGNLLTICVIFAWKRCSFILDKMSITGAFWTPQFALGQ